MLFLQVDNIIAYQQLIEFIQIFKRGKNKISYINYTKVIP